MTPRILGDAIQDRRSVEVLAPGDEPDLTVSHHGSIDERPPADGGYPLIP